MTPQGVLEASWIGATAPRRDVEQGLAATAVFSADILDRAAIRADAIILTIAGRPPRRRLRVREPLLVLVDDAGSRFFTVVEPIA